VSSRPEIRQALPGKFGHSSRLRPTATIPLHEGERRRRRPARSTGRRDRLPRCLNSVAADRSGLGNASILDPYERATVRYVRVSAKAVIIRADHLLVTAHRDERGEYYLLPGGGQESPRGSRSASCCSSATTSRAITNSPPRIPRPTRS